MTQSSFMWRPKSQLGAMVSGRRVPTSDGKHPTVAMGILLFAFLSSPEIAGRVPPVPTAGRAPSATEETAGLIQRGFNLLAQKDTAGAEAAFRRVIDIQPESPAAHRGLGLALWSERRVEAAWRELQVATRLDPADAEAHFALGKIAWTLSAQPDLAKPVGPAMSAMEFRRVALAELNKATGLRPLDFEMQLSSATYNIEAERAREAVAAAQQALRAASTAPQQAVAHATLGRASLVLGEIDRAEAEFNAALQLDPAGGEAHFGLGEVRLSQGKPLQAQRELRLAIRAAPDWAPPYSALAGVLIDQGQAGEARPLLEKAISLNPGDWQGQYRLATLLNEAGDTKQAVELFGEVARRQPDFLPVREQLGRSLLRRGDIQGATAQADALMAKEPGAAEGHRLMALALWKQRNYDGALAAAAMALNAEPESAAMLALQAIALWQLDRKKESRGVLVQAAKLQSNVTTAEVFCRLLLCDARDITLVGDFLRKNRWVIQPSSAP
jgi:tetratricopeptide (TPR) repeat protein